MLHLLAWEASLSGEPLRAQGFLRDALQILHDGGQLNHRVDVLSEAAFALETTAPRTAGRLLGAADAAYARRQIKRSVSAQERFEQLHARLAADLGEHDLAAALAEGDRLSLDEAIAEALLAVAARDERTGSR